MARVIQSLVVLELSWIEQKIKAHDGIPRGLFLEEIYKPNSVFAEGEW